jgi:hypothetical protein
VTIDALLAVAQSVQDQEVTAAADAAAQYPGGLVQLWNSLNASDGPDLRDLSDIELCAVQRLAVIGLFEVTRVAFGPDLEDEPEDDE